MDMDTLKDILFLSNSTTRGTKNYYYRLL